MRWFIDERIKLHMTTGFFYGYKLVAAGSAVQMMTLGCVYTYGVIFSELENEFGWSRAAISGAASLFFLLYGSFGIVVGSATDRFGPRIVLTICGILFSVGFLLLYQMESILELYLYYGLMCGVGMAAHDVSVLSTIARWFVKKRGLVTGIVKSGAGIGQMIVPLVAAPLIVNFGWRHTCLAIGLFALVLLVAVAQLFRRDPESVGLKPLRDKQNGDGPNRGLEGGFSLKEVLSKKQFWLLSFAKFADMFCLFTVILHIVPHGIDQGLGSTTAVMVLSAIGGCSILGRIFFGSMYDYLGARLSLMICFTTLLLSCVLLQLFFDPRLLFLFALIYGIAHGGFFTVASPSVADLFGTREHGIIFGLIIFFGTLGGTIGPVIAGTIFDQTKSYSVAFLLLTGMAALGIILTSQLRPTLPKVSDASTVE